MQLDKMYIKNYASIRLRSKSDGLHFKKKLSERKMAHEMEENMSSMSELQCQNR